MKTLSCPKSRFVIIIMLFAFTIGVTFVNYPTFIMPANAKGTTKTKPSNELPPRKQENSSNSPTQEKPPATSENSSRDSVPPPRDDNSFTRRQEQRDQSTDKSNESLGIKRGEGTSDVGGQILKRTERRDPGPDHNSHYFDRIYYPYDREMYSLYAYYQYQQPRWQDSRSSRHIPASIDEALMHIESAWLEENPEFLMYHVDPQGEVCIYQNGRYSHTLSPRLIFKLTVEAFDRIHTEVFQFTSVDHHGYNASARATHKFRGPDSRSRTVYLIYRFEKVRDVWMIRSIDIRTDGYGAVKCFIATAAYGSPDVAQVKTLRQFRDHFLMTNRCGRAFVGFYYKVSPSIARFIEEREWAKRTVRLILKPVVQFCKVVTPKAGT